MINTDSAVATCETDRLTSSEEVLGFSSALAASACVFKVVNGWDERVWVDARPVTTLAWRLSGAPVTCQWGKHRGRTDAGSAISIQPKGTPNHYLSGGAIHFAQLYLTDELLDQVADGIRPGVRASGALREDMSFFHDRDLSTLLGDYLASASSGSSKLELEARAILACAHLLRRHHGFDTVTPRPVGGLAGRQIRSACEAMEDNLDKDIGLEDLAKVAGVSATHFSRAFKQSTGMAPFAWLSLRRIERAKKLLADPRIPLADVALAVGFAAQPQFTTAFRRATGLTPSVWRRERLS